MSSKHSRHTPSPAPTSKLPKFLQKSRDRSKSVNEGALSSPEPPLTPSPSSSAKPSRKNTRIAEEPSEETPVIVEPVPIPSPRQRKPSSSETSHSTSPSARMGDLPTRLSGWFSHTFSTSSTDLSLPTLLAQSNSISTGSTSSPRARMTGASALLTAAKHGKGHLDKAMRYLLDSDATPDKCTDSIWILGVQHPGYEPPPMQPLPPPSSYPSGTVGRRGSVASTTASDQSHGHKRSRSRGQHAHSSSISHAGSQFLSQSQPPSSSRSESLSSSVSSVTATPSASVYNPALSTSSTQSATSKDLKPGANWPPDFYADFTSRIWLTYRSHFPPIRDSSLQELTPPACEPIMGPTVIPTPASPSTLSTASNASRRTSSRYTDSYQSDSSLSTSLSNNSHTKGPSSPTSTMTNRSKWNWTVGGLGGEKGWTSDSGWGCMLRTGQSLLANSLLFMHLGRDWRKPPSPEMTREYAMYVQIVTWFLDTPSELAPFSVHRMALAGKDLGKDVGMWFGPSTAAGAIKFLVHAYADAGLGVAVATDGLLTQTDVYAASHGSASSSYPRRGKGASHTSWGDRPVLVLFGIRLGLDGVNPIYYDTIKMLYTFPQSVGIAGGRPSSSYYFVGSQTDNLFYLDPHHARPAVPLRPPPTAAVTGPGSAFSTVHVSRPSGSSSGHGTTEDAGDERETDKEKSKKVVKKVHRHQTRSSSSGSSGGSGGSHQGIPGSPSSTRTGSSFHTPLAPSPLQQQYSRSLPAARGSNGAIAPNTGSTSSSPQPRTDSPASGHSGDMDYSELVGPSAPEHDLTPLEEHYATAYSAAELKTFHCDRVRKMPLSGLDPSMLIGFLCRDEKDWVDLRRRVGQLPKTIFSILDEAPSWAADSADNMGLESMSDPDEVDTIELGDEDDSRLEEDDPSPDVSLQFRSRSTSLSLSSASQHGSTGGTRSDRSKSEEIDTEEDPVDPITPGPSITRFDSSVVHVPLSGDSHDQEGSFDDADDDIEDDWVEPSIPSTPIHSSHGAQSSTDDSAGPAPAPAIEQTRSTSSTASKKKKPKKQVPVPVPKVRLPSPRESFPFPVATEEVSAEGPISVSYSSSSSMSGAGDDSVGVGASIREKRMHNARARDGGRTQSGGVKGVLTDDWIDGH
ncbi:peptidase family C54-domain-containing protein [Lentinula aciculospora]|uniref:Autophagy-related protein 4 n=1 Tax=Lentinula aciculospora TaxID=153920 RepID=A0A9W9DH53_9AGAR|nr:peptidase family C54-domain-containing protein [Lentinula aciculospora]